MSTSGSRLPRSKMKKASRRQAAEAAKVTIAGDPQPRRVPWSTAAMNDTRPVASRTTPR